jgi:hypothetical protein
MLPACSQPAGPPLVPHIRASYQACRAKSTNGRAAPGHGAGSERPIRPSQGGSEQRCAGCHGEEAWRRVKPFDAKMRFALAGNQRRVARPGDKGDSCASRLPTLGGAVLVAHDLAPSSVRAAVAFAPLTARSSRDQGAGHLGAQAGTLHNFQLWRGSWGDHYGWLPASGTRPQGRFDLVSVSSPVHPCAQNSYARSTRSVSDGAFGLACEKCHMTVSFKQGLASQ